MRIRFAIVAAMSIALGPIALAQGKPKPSYATSYMESWQGRPGKPDAIDHKPISRDTMMTCVLVEPGSRAGSACFVRYDNGGEVTLKLNQSVLSPNNDVAYLECLGDEPTHCKLQVRSK
jgi:hypothetical protein